MARLILFVCLLATFSVAGWAQAPTAPFTADANTLLLLKFDGNLSDASATNAGSAFSALSAHTNPTYVAAQTGFGQALEANGGSVNGVIVNAPQLSLTTAPLTVECWMKFPSAHQADDYSNTVLDLGAGRFLFRIRHEAGGNNVIPMINIYDGAGVSKYNYAVAGTSRGFSEDTWHHYALTYDVTANPVISFYFDGVKLTTVSEANPPAVDADFQKISFAGTTAGRPFPADSPTSNLGPLVGAIDEVRLSKGIRYGSAVQSNTLLSLKLNGNLNDSSLYGRNGQFTTVAGFTNPTFVAGRDTTAGQALEGAGASLNSVYVNAPELSQTTGPLTIEAWMYFPSSASAQDYTNTVLDLGASRFIFTVRHEAGGNNLIPTLSLLNESMAQEYNYAVVPRAMGWNPDEWHKVALTYDPTRTPAAEMFFDNQKLSLVKEPSIPAIASPFNKVAYPAMIAGRSYAGDNSHPLVGRIDDVILTRGILYGLPTSDPTIFHYKLDGNLLDSGPNAYNAVLSAIGGFTNPTYVAGHSGQALSGAGGDINGVVIPNTLVSQTSSPLTAEAWIYIPASENGQEFNCNIVDLSAGRFNFYVRHAGGADTSIYPTLGIYTGTPSVAQQNYTQVLPADGWTHDAWHHVAVTYDPGRETAVEFFFDGRRMSTLTSSGADPISAEFSKVNEQALVAGRVWAPSFPTQNLMPLRGRVDDIKLSRGILYTVTNQAVRVYADIATALTVDGNASDWSSLSSTELTLDTGGRGSLQAKVRYAWDIDNLYILIREAGTAAAQQEAANQAAYAAAPYSFDTVGFWFDLDNSNDGEQTAQDVSPWFGFSSTGRSDLFTGRLNNAAAFTQAPFISATVHTSGAFAQHNRVIEAALKWSDFALVVDGPRQPAGGLLGSIRAGFIFGGEPMLIENDYNKQSFIGGSQYTVPTGIDANSRDIVLRGPNAAGAWGLYE